MAEIDKNDLHLSGEFAKMCGITKSALHYYVSIGLIKPVLITESNYKYYATDQSYTIHLISILQKAGCSLDEIQSYLNGKGNIQEYRKMLEEKEQGLIDSKKDLEHTISMLHNINFYAAFSVENDFSTPMIRQIQTSTAIYTTKPATPIIAGSKEYAITYMNHMKSCETMKNALKYPVGRIMREHDFLMEHYKYSYLFSFTSDSFSSMANLTNTPMMIPKGAYVSYSFSGNTNAIPDAYQTVLNYIAEHNLTIIGNAFELNLADPLAVTLDNPNAILLSIPVA